VLTAERVDQAEILEELELLKSIFIEINKRKKLITVSTITRDKEIEKEYKRKVPIKDLTFNQTLFECVYDNNDAVAEKSLEFFKTLYCTG